VKIEDLAFNFLGEQGFLLEQLGLAVELDARNLEFDARHLAAVVAPLPIGAHPYLDEGTFAACVYVGRFMVKRRWL